jgi:hypothetical protein
MWTWTGIRKLEQSRHRDELTGTALVNPAQDSHDDAILQALEHRRGHQQGEQRIRGALLQGLALDSQLTDPRAVAEHPRHPRLVLRPIVRGQVPVRDLQRSADLSLCREHRLLHRPPRSGTATTAEPVRYVSMSFLTASPRSATTAARTRGIGLRSHRARSRTPHGSAPVEQMPSRQSRPSKGAYRCLSPHTPQTIGARTPANISHAG